MAFVDEFVDAVQTLYPKCCIQWEDFANINAVPILARYRDKICTFNDDIQGTAGIALAGILAALRLTGQKLTDQRFLFLGGGSAATGIAELISLAMAREGADLGRGAEPQCAVRRQRPLGDAGAPTSLIFRSRSPRTGRRSQPSSRRSRRCGRRASSASAPCQSCLPAR